MGLAMRALGNGLSVCVVQFAKAIDVPSGEVKLAKRLSPDLEVVRFGDSTIWGGLTPKRHLPGEARDVTSLAFQYASEQVFSSSWAVVVLDEIFVALSLDLLDEVELLHLIGDKPGNLELVLTGRDASLNVIDACDLVTEMIDVRHPSKAGVPARPGIEY